MAKSVLIVGAGPTGLVLALWLTKQGVPVRIIDTTTGPGTTSRALAVHARTLELYQQLDLADAIAAKGYSVPGVRLWLGGSEKGARSVRGDRHRPDALRVPAHLPAGRARTAISSNDFNLLACRWSGRPSFSGTLRRATIYARGLRGPDGAERTVDAGLHRRMRRRPLKGSGGDGRGLPGRELSAGLLCRRCRRRGAGFQRRPQRRARRIRLPRRLSIGGQGPRPVDRGHPAGRGPKPRQAHLRRHQRPGDATAPS